MLFTQRDSGDVLNCTIARIRTQLIVRSSISNCTGLSQAEAEKRVYQAYADAKKALETVREAAVLTGLGTVTALLVSLLAAWYAA